MNKYFLIVNITHIDQVIKYTITDLSPFLKYNFTIYITNSFKKTINSDLMMFSMFTKLFV